MPSETYRVVLSVEIERPALEVYEFLASPVNHIGLHPSTAGISGEDTGAVYGVGDIWREHIARPAGKQPKPTGSSPGRFRANTGPSSRYSSAVGRSG
jgi:hypothetical protein